MHQIGPEMQAVRQTDGLPRTQGCGAIREFRITTGLVFGVGGLVARSFTPGGLDPSYGGDRTSGSGFIRLRLG